MKKIFLLIGCVALMASCGNKEKANDAAVSEQPAVETTAPAPEAAAPAVEAAPACEFAQENAQKAKSFGLRQDEGKWILNYKNINAEGAEEGDLQKIELAEGTETVILNEGAASKIDFASLEKSVLNNKIVNLWLKDGKIAHIEEITQ